MGGARPGRWLTPRRGLSWGPSAHRAWPAIQLGSGAHPEWEETWPSICSMEQCVLPVLRGAGLREELRPVQGVWMEALPPSAPAWSSAFSQPHCGSSRRLGMGRGGRERAGGRADVLPGLPGPAPSLWLAPGPAPRAWSNQLGVHGRCAGQRLGQEVSRGWPGPRDGV